MSRRNRTWLRRLLLAWCVVAQLVCCAPPMPGAVILLRDGRQLRGKVGKTSSLAENPQKPEADGPPTITFLDDDLRRVFIPTLSNPGSPLAGITKILEVDTGEVPQRIAVKQIIAENGSRVQRVGPIVKVEPFDVLGHRTLTMMTDKGPLKVVQGITLITADYTKVEGMRTRSRTPIVWDMRIATSSIPTETLDAILNKAVDTTTSDGRLKIVRLLLQCERYKEAQKKLEKVIEDFPDEKERLADEVQALHQLNAGAIVEEIEVRKKAGQHGTAYKLLNEFPVKDVAGETLQQVREMLQTYQTQTKQLQQAYQDLKASIAKITDNSQREQCEPMLEEMLQRLNINTSDRLADYFRLHDDASLGDAEKVSLAISGWLLGANRGETNLYSTLALVRLREAVYQYLNEPVKLEREKLLGQLRGMEGAWPEKVALLLAHMEPPLESAQTGPHPGFYRLEVPLGVPEEPDATYYVQLPPEYDPYVRYPTIVTLNGAGTTPEQQIDWWAGARSADGTRLGQASRLGYIVISVDWRKEGQQEYGFTAREHAAVLVSLRDACRRFSIDTDRVFLSGHSMGGDAAWDIGLAHPDLWAGVIPIVALADKYCSRYWQNARRVPFYVLAGELDGDKTIKNARDLDRYLQSRFDVTVTEYIGRGHEDFYEDIKNIFDWMSRRQRDFFPKEFTVSTMRTWDNYFWYFEGSDFPERAMVDPISWPPNPGVRPLEINGKLTANNGITINTGGVKATVWLSPEMVDFTRRVPISINGKVLRAGGLLVEPDLAVLLEDVRTRADREHPFWAKVEN